MLKYHSAYGMIPYAWCAGSVRDRVRLNVRGPADPLLAVHDNRRQQQERTLAQRGETMKKAPKARAVTGEAALKRRLADECRILAMAGQGE